MMPVKLRTSYSPQPDVDNEMRTFPDSMLQIYKQTAIHPDSGATTKHPAYVQHYSFRGTTGPWGRGEGLRQQRADRVNRT